ncbi:MAG: hypothetical protein ACE5FC_09345, partial [Myxococcota bacterium]
TVRYKRDIPELFKYNALCVISDGVNNKMGSFFAPYEFFYAWRKVGAVSNQLPSTSSGNATPPPEPPPELVEGEGRFVEGGSAGTTASTGSAYASQPELVEGGKDAQGIGSLYTMIHGLFNRLRAIGGQQLTIGFLGIDPRPTRFGSRPARGAPRPAGEPQHPNQNIHTRRTSDAIHRRSLLL